MCIVTRKTAGTAEIPARQQATLVGIQTNIKVLSVLQIYTGIYNLQMCTEDMIEP